MAQGSIIMALGSMMTTGGWREQENSLEGKTG